MKTPTHYFNFKPCEAVQWTGNNGDAVAALLGHGHRDWTRMFNCFVCAGWRIEDGQWLIRQDGKVWVQDEEPARFERWLFGSPTEGFQWVEGVGLTGTLTHRRPVVTVGDQEWNGPWEAVDEDL